MHYLGLVGFLITLGTIGRWFMRAWSVDIPKSPIVFQLLSGIGGILGLLALTIRPGDPMALAAIGLAALYIFLSSTSGQRTGEDGLKVGDDIPLFSLPDDNDVQFDSTNLVGSRVLLKFFRGHW